MEVTTDRSIYLRGRACNLYTGNSWLNSQPDNIPLDGTNKMSFDILE